MKNFLEIIFTIFGLVCCIDFIYEKLNNTWFFDFENNYIFIAVLIYQALNFSKENIPISKVISLNFLCLKLFFLFTFFYSLSSNFFSK